MAGATPLDKTLSRPRSMGEARLLLVRERFGSVSRFAGRLGVDISQLSKVIRGKERSRPLERKLARALGMRLHELFPEWYGREARVA